MYNDAFKQIIKNLNRSDKKIENVYFIFTLLALGITTPGGWFFIDSYRWDWRVVITITLLIYFLFIGIIIRANRHKNYSEIKKEIGEKIRNRFKDKPLIIIIDDLDRSDPEDIKQIFKLVKSDANFKHIIYILSYDRKIIQEKITDEANFFFDKIVQLPIEVKTPDRQDLQKYLAEKVNKLLDKYTYYQKELQNSYLIGLFFGNNFNYHGKLFDLFKNLRMIDKFLQCFEGELEGHKDYLGYDICLGDLALIEFIRLYDPAVYSYIKNNQQNWLEDCKKLKLTNEGNAFLLKNVQSEFVGEKQNIYLEILNFCFINIVTGSSPYYAIIGGKIYTDKVETLATYFSNTILGDSHKTSQKDISDLENNEVTIQIVQKFLENKDVCHFCQSLVKYSKNKDIKKFIIPLLELGDQYEFTQLGLSYEQSGILNLLNEYYKNENPELTFIDLLKSNSVLMLLYFLAGYKAQFKDTQVTHQYKLTQIEWEDLGNKIHAKMLNKFSEILEKPNLEFQQILFCSRDIVSKEQFEEIKKLVSDQLQITNEKSFDKNKFINFLTKFS